MKMIGKYFLLLVFGSAMFLQSCKDVAPKPTDEITDNLNQIEEDKVLSQEVYKQQMEDSMSIETYELSEVDQLPLFDASCLTAAEPENCSKEKINTLIDQYLTFKKGDEVNRYVEFTISKVGEIQDVNYVSNAAEICLECKTKAIEVISDMQRWEPAVKNGAPVSTKMRIEI
jgi:hypothetical protein